MLKGLGSVLPSSEPAAAAVADSVWTTWTAGAAETSAFATARGALAALLRARGVRRLWMPSYCCAALAEGARAAEVEIGWYGVDARLVADLEALEAALAPDDAVLAIAYFGRAPDEALRALAARRPDVLWIEDRAQALETGVLALGTTLYSPRKLLGVADGGILVGKGLPEATKIAPDEAALWRPNDLRRVDPDGLEPGVWFTAFRAREAAFDAAPLPCSDRTLMVLRHRSLALEAKARRSNWRTLAPRLADLALWPDLEPIFAPMAFPVVTQDAGALAAALADQRIWAARHWVDLPSPKTFDAAHALSGRCVSLPLDGRYDAGDMNRIADAVLAFVKI